MGAHNDIDEKPGEENKPSDFFDDDISNSKQTSVSSIPVMSELGMALSVLLIVFGVTYVSLPGAISKNTDDENIVETRLVSNAPIEQVDNPFDSVTIQARGAFVWDVKNQKVLFNKNGDDVLPLASVTKLMTTLVAHELLDARQTIPISRESLKTEGDSGFSDGETFTLQNLTDLTLIASSNDGAVAIATRVAHEITDSKINPESVIVEAMNMRAKDLGLTNTHYKNSTGLDLSPSEAGAYGTARDMALLMEYVIQNIPDAVAETTTRNTTINNNSGEYHIAKNTNEIVNQISGLIASKTGYTELAGGNLVIAFNAGLDRPIVIAVLGSTYKQRFNDTLELVDSVQKYIEIE